MFAFPRTRRVIRTVSTVLACLHVILNEEWEHHRYAVRDLEVLEDH